MLRSGSTGCSSVATRSPPASSCPRSALDEAEILSLALARTARGRGHSHRLLSRHLHTLAHAGIAQVHLEVEEGNAPALALYRRLGFVEAGRRPGYYARPDGSRASAWSMTLTLRDPAHPPSMTGFGLAARVAILTAAFALFAPAQLVALRVAHPVAQAIPMRFHRLFLRLFGIRIVVRGTAPPPGSSTLILANHVSWLDIPVLSGLLPLSFIAKSEIATWPVFGFCARLQRCIFLDRSRKGATHEVNAEVAARLADGDAIVLFPEGTTGDGNRLLPFKSSLVGAARAALNDSGADEIRLQPVAISYVRRNGLPVTRRERPDIAWYGDMELPPHARLVAGGGPLDVVVHWSEPIPFGNGTDRKRATSAAETAVRAAIGADSRFSRPPAAGLATSPYSHGDANGL